MANTDLIITERSRLVAIANAVRANSDITSEISLDGIVDGVNYVASYVAANTDNGIDTSDATAEASDIMEGETAYVDGNKITGTFTLDTELSTQDNLIAEIQTAVDNLPEASGEPVLQDKTVTPTTSAQTITADSGYDGLDTVTVNAMPTATQATPSITVSSSGLITASATQSAGYVSSGTKSATKQLTTQSAKTITPSASSQTAVSSGVYTTGAVTVGAIPSTYVKPTTTKSATTYTPTTSNQTIAAGTYCSGAQTIEGDANLVAENIAEGVSIFGVTGTHSGGSSGGGGGTSGGVINVTVYNTSMNPVYYWDESGTLCTVNAYNSTAINAKNGVLFYQQEVMTLCSGDYLKHNMFGMCIMVFLSDGGTVSCQGQELPIGGN